MSAVPMNRDGYPGFIEQNRITNPLRIRRCIFRRLEKRTLSRS